MGTSFNRSGNAGIIVMEGDLTLPYAADMRSALIKALLDADDISVAIENVQDVDLSCLQLLCSAHRSAVRLKKHVAFKQPLPRIFSEMVEAAGFTRMTGCKLDCEKNCIWMPASGVKNE